MRRPARSTWLPLAAFLVALGMAVGLSFDAGASPEANLYVQVRAYLRALHSGDPEAAAPYRFDGDPRGEVSRADALEAVTFLLEHVEVGESGTEAMVSVIWLLAENRGLREVQIWTREPEGPWLFRAVQGVPERIGR